MQQTQNLRKNCFNPRPHAEGDPTDLNHFGSNFCFNPRPHAEGDELSQVCKASRHSFNPRPHAEGDWQQSYDPTNAIVSIHALTRRATCRFSSFYL